MSRGLAHGAEPPTSDIGGHQCLSVGSPAEESGATRGPGAELPFLLRPSLSCGHQPRQVAPAAAPTSAGRADAEPGDPRSCGLDLLLLL